uniref:Uncharacterized protein n=1 Tax=Graphocephala atropunctata TaxID=36148 RepID=A0A1B6KNM6_9HEMI
MRKFLTENIKLFSQLLFKETWIEVYCTRVEEKYNIFLKLFAYYFEQAFPKTLITKTNTKKNNWLTDELKTKRVEIIELTKEFRKTKSINIKNLLKQENDKYKKELNQAKTEYFQGRIDNSSNVQKTVWRIINSEVGEKGKPHLEDIVLNVGTHNILDPKLISNLFNDYFVNVVADMNVNDTGHIVNVIPDIVHNDNLVIQPKFSLRPIEDREVEKVIDLLKNKN